MKKIPCRNLHTTYIIYNWFQNLPVFFFFFLVRFTSIFSILLPWSIFFSYFISCNTKFNWLFSCELVYRAHVSFFLCESKIFFLLNLHACQKKKIADDDVFVLPLSYNTIEIVNCRFPPLGSQSLKMELIFLVGYYNTPINSCAIFDSIDLHIIEVYTYRCTLYYWRRFI